MFKINFAREQAVSGTFYKLLLQKKRKKKKGKPKEVQYDTHEIAISLAAGNFILFYLSEINGIFTLK